MCGCVLSQPLSGVVTAEKALKYGQTACGIIFWHLAVYWKVGSRDRVSLQNLGSEPWGSIEGAG